MLGNAATSLRMYAGRNALRKRVNPPSSKLILLSASVRNCVPKKALDTKAKA
jgi:hypothetical protein